MRTDLNIKIRNDTGDDSYSGEVGCLFTIYYIRWPGASDPTVEPWSYIVVLMDASALLMAGPLK